ncbi:unnamed protein product [Brassica rapa subsp. trilocularis]
MSTLKTSSSSAKTALVFNAMDPKTPLISVNMASITKLTTNNYITWTLQVRALLEAHELHCFIDQTENTPSPTVVTNGVETLNPLFAPWKRQDIMLYRSILGTLSPNVQPIVSSATTTKEIWNMLAGTYGTPSRRHIKQIKQEFKRSVKGTQTVDGYMTSIIKTADELAVLGSPVEHEDLLDIITDGLGDDYRAIVEMVNGRDIPITLDELHEKLVEREHTLLTTSVSASASSSSTHVTVSVKGQDEEELRVFRMRRNDKMSKVMERYNDARGAEPGTYAFLSEGGSMINKDKTPDEMEIKDGYQIDAMLHQHGGFGPSSIKFFS